MESSHSGNSSVTTMTKTSVRCFLSIFWCNKMKKINTFIQLARSKMIEQKRMGTKRLLLEINLYENGKNKATKKNDTYSYLKNTQESIEFSNHACFFSYLAHCSYAGIFFRFYSSTREYPLIWSFRRCHHQHLQIKKSKKMMRCDICDIFFSTKMMYLLPTFELNCEN